MVAVNANYSGKADALARATPRGRVRTWVRTQIRGGFLAAGDTLPGERAVAEAVGVSRETVRAVWGELERAGVIEAGRAGKMRRIRPRPTPEMKPQTSTPLTPGAKAISTARQLPGAKRLPIAQQLPGAQHFPGAGAVPGAGGRKGMEGVRRRSGFGLESGGGTGLEADQSTKTRPVARDRPAHAGTAGETAPPLDPRKVGLPGDQTGLESSRDATAEARAEARREKRRRQRARRKAARVQRAESAGGTLEAKAGGPTAARGAGVLSCAVLPTWPLPRTIPAPGSDPTMTPAPGSDPTMTPAPGNQATPGNSAAPSAVHRVFNFSSGPCTLPLEVLQRAQAEFVDYQGLGMSAIEMSHRSKPIVGLHEAALASLRELLNLSDDYEVVLMGGGATMQFGMIPMNLATDGQRVDYTHSGAWAKKAIADAKAVGADVNMVWDGTDENYVRLPDPTTVQSTAGSAYLHLTSNETIGGLQWKRFPKCEAPLVADMSSDFLSRPIDLEPFGLIYAGAQKNIGPAGVVVVIIRKDVLERCNGRQVNYLNYANHVKGGSMLNTPPVFQIYMMGLVLDWLKAKGGVAWAAEMAAQRSTRVYDAMAASGGFYNCPIDPANRSSMNIVFRLPTEELEAKFVADATAQGLDGLKGHRSVGGCRASLYNAMPVEGAQALADFMGEFARTHG